MNKWIPMILILCSINSFFLWLCWPILRGEQKVITGFDSAIFILWMVLIPITVRITYPISNRKSQKSKGFKIMRSKENK